MSPHSSDPPPHPPDLANRDIPAETIPSGTRLVRIHHGKFDPIYFGFSDFGRFDDPRRIFGVCYLATTIAGAFAETFVRGASNGAQNHLFAQERSVSEIEVTASLRLSTLHGPGLARVGATSAVSSGSHGVARNWSRAFHDHPSVPDGIAYRSKHDDDEICIALFDRASERIEPAGAPKPMMSDLYGLAELCACYGIGFRWNRA